MFFLWTASNVMKSAEAFFAGYGLSTGKFAVMMLLMRHPDAVLTPSDCAELSGASRGTMTKLLAGLERQGLIIREPHPIDGRMARVRLSEQGMSLLEKILPEHLRLTTRLMATLSDKEKRSLRELMKKLQTQVNQL